MQIGLIDVDGHHFPNLALMRISAYHKSRGDNVEWWWSDLVHYDIVYMSKVFSNEYTPDVPEPMNADRVIKGGTGYCISLGDDGKEHFDKSKNNSLPPEMEHTFPDYSIYPDCAYAISMTSRGCPRGCAFCHVAAKEGRCAVKVADVKDFWTPDLGKNEIKVMDSNITACREKRDLMRQYRETGVWLDFMGGLDIRFLDDDDIDDINHMKIKYIHFAWDNPKEDLEDRFKYFAANYRKAHKGMVYCLVNFDSTMEENLHRIYTLDRYGFDPYVMVYDKPNAAKEIINLQRWCNNKFVFRKCKRFEDYVPGMTYKKAGKGELPESNGT